MRNLATSVKVGVLVVLGLVAFFVFLSFIQDQGLKGEMTEYSAVIADASGLAPKTQVRVAGIAVGEITRIQLENGKARVFFTVRSDVPVYPNAVLAKRSASLLGDFVLDLNPGAPQERNVEPAGNLWQPRGLQVVPASFRLAQAEGAPPPDEPLPPGGEVTNVKEAVQIEAIFESLDAITDDVEVITESLREALAGEETSIKDLIANLDRITERLDGTIASSSAKLEAILDNTQAVTADIRALTEAKDDEVGEIITNVRLITEQTREILSSVQGIVGEDEDELRESVGGVRNAVASLNKSLENLESITGKIERGEGTVGRLVSDKELGDKIADAAYDAADYIETLTQIQVEVALRSEYLINEEGAKNYLQLRLIPRPDKYFFFEVIDDPRGFVERETVVRSPPGSEEVANQEIRITRDRLKFSAQFAKRYYFTTFRFGLIESTGGLGLDLNFLEDHLVFKMDAFDFANPASDYPRVKASLNLLFLSHLFVTAGVDDVLNPRDVEANTGRILLGRDYFLGGGIYFTDQDLKALFGVGVPIGGAL
ncbi:MlaD family protein [Vulgatibacter sp.]|uniref:MlaD family protein n=1 Tax=Vulgatibacter sp. TaxID=1971226 RepID=UPI003564369A